MAEGRSNGGIVELLKVGDAELTYLDLTGNSTDYRAGVLPENRKPGQ